MFLYLRHDSSWQNKASMTLATIACENYNTLFASWKDGKVKIGTGYEVLSANTILTWNDPNGDQDVQTKFQISTSNYPGFWELHAGNLMVFVS